MGRILHHHHHHQHQQQRLITLRFAAVITTVAFLLLLLLASSSVSAIAFSPSRQFMWKIRDEVAGLRRRLGGPGSSPPTCRSKCGWCSPCTAVRVAIQPGWITPLEYYPEAWRCKCGNKLFMP